MGLIGYYLFQILNACVPTLDACWPPPLIQAFIEPGGAALQSVAP
jgi:hypothetical protein